MSNTNASFNLTAAVTAALVTGSIGSNTLNLNFGGPYKFAPGAGAGGYNSCYINSRTVSNGTPDVMNLTSGLLNPDGSAAAFADIVAVGFFNASVTPGQNLLFGGGTGAVTTINGATGVITIYPGQVFVITCALAAGYAITASSADKLNMNVAAGASVPYNAIILGH